MLDVDYKEKEVEKQEEHIHKQDSEELRERPVSPMLNIFHEIVPVLIRRILAIPNPDKYA